MTKLKKKENKVYQSFEQWKAEIFPKGQSTALGDPNRSMAEVALCLAEESFNKVLTHKK